MKANRAARAHEAGAEVIGALVIFAIFVAVIAILNVTSVPNAGLAAEEEHFADVLTALNGIQAEAETAAGSDGASVGRSIELAPSRSIGQDFFSYFMATPARASGELVFEPDYGDVKVLHYRNGVPTPFYDLGSASGELPIGRITFDPHPVFRSSGVIQLENGGVVTTTDDGASMRYDPPVTLSLSGGTTYVAIHARVLNGTGVSIGGNAPVRLVLTSEAGTITSPPSNNAQNVTMTLTTDHGAAWAEYLTRISSAAGLVAGTQYFAATTAGGGGAPDVVTWMVNGTATGNDVRLTTGIAVYTVRVS